MVVLTKHFLLDLDLCFCLRRLFLLHFNNVQGKVKLLRNKMKQVGILLIMTGELVTGLENGLARTPPMGWLAWERFRLVKVILASLGKIQVSQGDPS